MAFQDKPYKVRGGTIALGTEYEFKITTLFALRCIAENVLDLWIASNAEGVGSFDDIILRISKSGGRRETYMFQLKHQEKPKSITEEEFLEPKGDFSLAKYLDDIGTLQKHITNGKKNIVQDLGKFANITFVIFTNRGADTAAFLESGHSAKLVIFNTQGSIHRVKLDQLPQSCKLCTNVHLLSNQVHVKFVDERIEAEVARIAKNFRLPEMDVRDVAEKFTKYMTDWIKGDLGGHYYLTKRDLLRKVGELLFWQYAVDLSRECLDFYECGQKLIWNDVVANKVVTVVDADADQAVVDFLKSYIGSEVRQYCSEKHWGGKLSSSAKEALYRRNKDINDYMPKIAGNYAKIDPAHIYKYLWLTNKIPLLLKAQTETEYDHILKIVKISNCALRVIIINKTGATLPSIEIPSPEYFFSLSDLDDKEKAKILQQHVRVQGRSFISLENLVDKTTHKHIKCRDIVHILLSNLDLGNHFDFTSTNYIPRGLLPIFVRFTVLYESHKDAVVIVTDQQDVLESKLNKDLQQRLHSDSIIIQESEHMENLHKFRDKNVHYLRYTGESWFEWRKSEGSVAWIRHCLAAKGDVGLITSFFPDHMLNRTHIIVGAPGMGKSTLLDFLAIEAPPTHWVIKVVLNKHGEYFGNTDTFAMAQDHLRHFQKELDSAFAKAVFERLLEEKKVLVLLDGLDEVVPEKQGVVIAIAKTLHDEGYTMWITTRPHLQVELEEKFSTIATKLTPFTKPDQKSYLVNHFTKSIKSNREDLKSLIENFVRELLSAARVNLYDWGHQFTEIPLQCFLLAEVFKDQFEKTVRKRKVILERNFDLLYLYNAFLKMKTDILCSKFGELAKEMCFFFEKYQKLFALTVVFHKHVVLKRLLDAHLQEYYRSEQKLMPLLVREGIAVLEQNNSDSGQKFDINFVHRTFAEYLSAQWLFESFGSPDVEIKAATLSLIREKRNVPDYQFLFKVFDCFLADDCPLLKHVINGQLEEAKQLMNKKPGCVNLIDGGGRTILHIAALYGVQHPHPHSKAVTPNDKMADLIGKIPGDKIDLLINVKDKLLGYNPLDYAVAVRKSLTVANKLCKASQNAHLNIDLTARVNFKLNATYCVTLNYRSLFPFLLRNYIYGQILWKYEDQNKPLSSHIYKLVKLNGIKNILRQTRASTMAELFQFRCLKTTSKVNPDYFYNLFCASAFGSKENIHYLLGQGFKVDETDIYGNIALHCAAIHDRSDSLTILLSNSPMHINKRNNRGDSPLLLAIKFKATSAMDFLLSKGADISITNNSGNSALHCAAAYGSHEVLPKLTVTEFDVSAKNKFGQTPLHVAVERSNFANTADVEEQIKVVDYLLEHCSDVNMKNCEGRTPLYYLVKMLQNNLVKDFQKKSVTLLQDKVADVSVRNQLLCMAVENGNDEIASLIRQRLHENVDTGVPARDFA